MTELFGWSNPQTLETDEESASVLTAWKGLRWHDTMFVLSFKQVPAWQQPRSKYQELISPLATAVSPLMRGK